VALHNKVLIGMALGALAGGAANLGDIGWLRSSLVGIEPAGTAFIRLITMIVVPLVVASIVVGAASLGDIRRLGRIGGKTLVYFLLNTAAAVTLGLLLSNLVQPVPSVKDILLGIIPRNPVRAAADFELLPLIFFSVVFALIAAVVARLGPREFFRRIAAVQLFAFSTSSANATLPLTMQTAEVKLGISKSVSSFVLPLGASTNKGGSALYQAVAVMFIAQIYGMPLDLGRQLMVLLAATLASIGTAGVPGADRILDMARTAVNVTGDLACAAVIARTEDETLPGGLKCACS
jgi:Na+/H+-dicarboxylate symporter